MEKSLFFQFREIKPRPDKNALLAPAFEYIPSML